MRYIISNKGDKWEYVIGLEVHAQITSLSKLFSSANAVFGQKVNSAVALLDAAIPGSLPVLNEYCVHQAIKTGLALNARINKYSMFDRKNYFYPDLPQGYQISQFYFPIVSDGYIEISGQDEQEDGKAKVKKIRINRLHLEQDAGKSMHDDSFYSLIDLNRSGVALMEIVTEPDLSSPLEAAEYIKKLRNILIYVGSCSGDMEKGALRCDANVSVRRPGEKLGERCEIKNLNSIKHIIKAIEYEARRQIDLLENNQKIISETRLFNVEAGETRSMRSKEEALDYRYFPDPDLLPLVLTDELIEGLSKSMPELPEAKVKRYVENFALAINEAENIVNEKELMIYFEQAVSNSNNSKIIYNLLMSELLGRLDKGADDLVNCKVTPSKIAQIADLIAQQVISSKISKIIFDIMLETGQEVNEIIKEHNLVQLSDKNALIKIAKEVLAENQESVISYKNGKDKLFGFFVGKIMQKTQGKANPGLVNDILKELLEQ